MAIKKTTKKATKPTTKKMAHKTKAKVARRTKAKGPKTGRITGQQRQSLQRLDPLTKKYQAEGMSPEDARQSADMALVSVRDDGVALSPDFDIKNSKGLGMRIVAALSEQLGASITQHAYDIGKEFTVSVPLK